MNHWIKIELDKIADILPPYNSNTTQLYIPKKNIDLKPKNILVGKYYMIQVNEYLLNDLEGMTYAIFWNNGIKPPENKLMIKVLEEKGKLIRVYSQGCSTNNVWTGWLPIEDISFLSELVVKN